MVIILRGIATSGSLEEGAGRTGQDQGIVRSRHGANFTRLAWACRRAAFPFRVEEEKQGFDKLSPNGV
jgi:hypothetical protein